MSRQPAFIDNREGNTLARALSAVLGVPTGEQVGEGTGPPDLVRIATAFFSPTGFAQIAEALSRVPEVRLLLGADHTGGAGSPRRGLGEPPRRSSAGGSASGYGDMDDGLRWDRDRLPYTRTSATALRTLIAALRGGNMEVRRYERRVPARQGVHPDIGRRRIRPIRGRHRRLLEPDGCRTDATTWSSTSAATTSPLSSEHGHGSMSCGNRPNRTTWPRSSKSFFQLRRPWEIFIRVLWQLYGDEVAEDAQADENLPLTSFQKHGVARALRLIREAGGCIVADEVGLGKTFVAGEILQIYRERRQRAVLICPAALRDTTWKKFLSTYQLFVECLSFEQLASDRAASRRAASLTHANSTSNARSTSISSWSSTKPTTTGIPMPRLGLRHYGH